MNSEMIKFFLSGAVPCGFADSEGEIKANAKMVDFLGLNKDAPEMLTLLEKIRTEKSPFFVIIKLVSDFKKAPKVWHFHFLPLFCSENGYLGTFFHAHEFLFLSPLEYVDGIQPYAGTTEKPNKLFTNKEWEVLFFTMYRLSSKDIARKLGIFPSTVEFYLKAIYGKVNVHSACQLRAFCKSKGFERYIPVNLLPRSCGKAVQSVGGVA
ncbi:helix-turn-helix transcriptional regulator [Arsenophonus nasoniae]|uniref:LuxR C-terminal-related transcriptional regulator n=1 Tax=Arsenophonus nasoniae TaxID=638 RepID=A0ABY8NZ41_9GAMM|nr:LuxR C-terminal-related transcriptional regulator [Arsenophonus nasoniae]WGM08915.1 LuxR C-terminal-related transcriptional regulator [Arsenophonus nasoniae]